MNVKSVEEFISNRVKQLEYDIKTLQEMISDLQTDKETQRNAIKDFYMPKEHHKKYIDKMNSLLRELD
jgi:prefoldin subunit 5